MAFTVVKIVNENTIMVHPEWRLRKLNKGGKFVRLNGYNIPGNRPAKDSAKSTLVHELLGKQVKLLNPMKITPNGYVICDVMVEGRNASEFFPEFRVG